MEVLAQDDVKSFYIGKDEVMTRKKIKEEHHQVELSFKFRDGTEMEFRFKFRSLDTLFVQVLKYVKDEYFKKG